MDFSEQVHVIISTITFSLLAASSLLSILLYIQHKMLRQHPNITYILKQFPPMIKMEKLLFTCIILGFITLTVTLILCLISFSKIVIFKHSTKLIFSSCAWFIFAFLLYGRYKSGWRGLIAIRWTLTGMLMIILTYICGQHLFYYG